jgi:iron-sulfur cluster repair protein YtfE (RIC family)
MRDPIDRLLEEHRGIMRQVEELRRGLRALRERGDGALPEVRPLLQGTMRMLEGELLAHARREEEALFPALERVFGAEGTPTAVMRQEHRDIHAQADRFRATLRQLNEVEHPAIVAGSARLAAVPGGLPAAELAAIASDLVRLLDDHFAKEEEILFPMAREILAPEDLEAVSSRMDALG